MSARDRNWPGADGDPEGSEFYSFPARVPEGEWAYAVDDFGMAYDRGTPFWPFRYANEGQQRAVIEGWKRKGFPSEEGCGWRAIRLAPDTEYCSAGQNYVTVYPSNEHPAKAWAGVCLYVRPQGMGAITVSCLLDIDLDAMTATYRNLGPALPEDLKAQAEEKKTKILALLAEHIARRNAGKQKIETVYDRTARKAAGS